MLIKAALFATTTFADRVHLSAIATAKERERESNLEHTFRLLTPTRPLTLIYKLHLSTHTRTPPAPATASVPFTLGLDSPSQLQVVQCGEQRAKKKKKRTGLCSCPFPFVLG